MISGQLTSLIVSSKESKYAGLTAPQAARRFLGRHRLIVTAYMVTALVLIISCITWMGPNIEHPEAQSPTATTNQM